MKEMKRILLFLVFIITTLLANGQTDYDLVLRAVSLSDRGEAGEAATILAGLQGIGSDVNLLLLRGDIYLKAGQVKQAKNDFMAAENLSQGSGLYGLARCAATDGDARAATVYLEAHLKSSYKKNEPDILLDDTFSQISSSTEWKALWKKEWYKSYERESWEIENYLKSDRTDLAVDTWKELSAVYPDLPVTDYCNASILMSQGNYSEAAGILSRLTQEQDVPADWLYLLAKARAAEGNYYAAAAVYSKLINAGQPDPGLLLLRSGMLIKSGDRDAAKNDLERYLAVDPDNSEALGMIGKTYAEEGAIYEALPYLNANVEKHPGESSAFRLRGDAWFASKTWDKAAEDYSMSLDLDPNNGTVNLNIGISLIKNGKPEEACYYLRKAKALGEKKATEYLAKYCIK